MARSTAPRRALQPRPNRARGRLSTGLAHLFWDYPGRALSLERDRDLVIRRIAGEGGLREIRLLRSRVGDDAIRELIGRTEARGLSPQRIRFWQLLLELPPRRANAWVRTARRSHWGRRSRP